tara:strand:- start:349 stop:1341 length:993 start_codon:yes stop_codon:yes gene_type:complete
MKILITGAAGFIGFHSCLKFLKNGYSVVGIDNLNNYYDVKIKKDRIKYIENNYNNKKNFNFFKMDLCNYKKIDKLFKKQKFDYVLNLAAQAGVRHSLTHPFAYINSNLLGFFNLIQLSKNYKVKHFIYASTSSVYGGNKKMPFSENDNTDIPLQLYAATKKSNELIAHSYSHLYKLQTSGLRFFTVYGPWGRPDMALFSFVKNILQNKKINIFNNGNHSRDFTYIDDIVNGIYKISVNHKKIYKKSKNFYQIFNIGRGKSEKLMHFINEIEKNLKIKSKKNFLPLQKGDVIKTYSNTSKLVKYFNYKPKVSIKIGIKNFINWYLSYYKLK